MLDSDIPVKLPIRWAESAAAAYKRLIPVASQIGVTDGAASLTDGFVPLNATPIGAGGVPPDIKDMNGILFEISGWARWMAAGGPILFDGTFATAIGGYPAGAVLRSSGTANLFWVSTANGNTTDPDGGSPANWLPLIPVAASNGEITAGVVTTKYVSPAGLAALRASGADLTDGSSNSKYVTPGALATLRSVVGDLTTGSSVSKYVTPAALAGLRAAVADLAAGSNNALYVTPQSLLGVDGTDYHFGNPWYFTLPGGILVQGGDFTFTSDNYVTITFPKPFAWVWQVFPTQYQTGGGDQDNNAIQGETLSTTAWTAYCWGAGGGRGMRMKWWAIGRSV